MRSSTSSLTARGRSRIALLVLVLGLALATVACGATPRSPADSAQAAEAKPLPRPVRLARADAARRRHVTTGRVRVVKVTRRTWPDGCLGLGGPAICTAVLTPGYRAIFSARGKRLVYRTDLRSRYRLEPA